MRTKVSLQWHKKSGMRPDNQAMSMFERAHRRVPTITDKHIKRRKKPRAFKNILTQKMHVSMTKGKLGRCKVMPPMEHSQFIYFWAFAAFLFFRFCSRIILTPYHNYYLSYNSTTSHIKKKEKKGQTSAIIC